MLLIPKLLGEQGSLCCPLLSTRNFVSSEPVAFISIFLLEPPPQLSIAREEEKLSYTFSGCGSRHSIPHSHRCSRPSSTGIPFGSLLHICPLISEPSWTYAMTRNGRHSLSVFTFKKKVSKLREYTELWRFSVTLLVIKRELIFLRPARGLGGEEGFFCPSQKET